MRSSSSVMLVKLIATIIGVLAIGWYLMMNIPPKSDTKMLSMEVGLIGLIIGIIGIWLGTIKIFKKSEKIPTLNTILIMTSILMLIAMTIIGGSKIDTGKQVPIEGLIEVMLYGIFMLSYMELGHAVIRFTAIEEQAKTQNLTDFSIAPVILNYFIWFPIIIGIVGAITFLILYSHYWVLTGIQAIHMIFGKSVELNSIYIFAITVTLIFVPIAIILAFIFGEGNLLKSTKTILIKATKKAEEESTVVK